MFSAIRRHLTGKSPQNRYALIHLGSEYAYRIGGPWSHHTRSLLLIGPSYDNVADFDIGISRDLRQLGAIVFLAVILCYMYRYTHITTWRWNDFCRVRYSAIPSAWN